MIRRAKILELTHRVALTILLIAIGIGRVLSQEINTASHLEFRYGFHMPGADMADRFGNNSDIGAAFNFANLNNNLYAGIEGMFMFGPTVKEDVLAELRGVDGSIIGIGGSIADINLKERGFYIGLNAGKVFKTTSHEKNMTGIRAQLGGGLLQHKIRVQDNSRSAPLLVKDYLPAYDRLTNGPAVHLGVGFQYQSPKDNLHFSIMGDLYGARTKSRRDYDNATGGYLDQKRTDILAGLTLSYIVQISRRTASDNIYY